MSLSGKWVGRGGGGDGGGGGGNLSSQGTVVQIKGQSATSADKSDSASNAHRQKDRDGFADF